MGLPPSKITICDVNKRVSTTLLLFGSSKNCIKFSIPHVRGNG